MKKTSIRLTEEQFANLRKTAILRGFSIAKVVRDAIDEFCRNEEAQREDKRKRALEVAGRFRSGRGDVSKKHDAHLDEAFK
jgi:hypothetical protein